MWCGASRCVGSAAGYAGAAGNAAGSAGAAGHGCAAGGPPSAIFMSCVTIIIYQEKILPNPIPNKTVTN